MEETFASTQVPWFLNVKEIISSVNLTDNPIIFTICFHVISLIFLLFSRKHTYVSSVYFVFLVTMISLTPKINYYMMENWEKFGFSSNYFDESYSFIMIFWAMPLSVICITMMTMLVIDTIRYFMSGSESVKTNN